MRLLIVGAASTHLSEKRNDAAVPTLGRIELRRVTTAADARAETEPPHGYGVYVPHGAFTLWNMPP